MPVRDSSSADPRDRVTHRAGIHLSVAIDEKSHPKVADSVLADRKTADLSGLVLPVDDACSRQKAWSFDGPASTYAVVPDHNILLPTFKSNTFPLAVKGH